MTRIQHAGGAVSATLSSSITSGDTTITCDNLAGWPDGSVGPFYAVINRGKPTEEKIRAAGRSTNTLTGVLRGQDGTTASAHSSAETIDHIFTALEADAANAHIEATTGIHGTTGALVGTTQVQTLTNKTLTTPVINGGTLSGTITNGGTISGGTVDPSVLRQGGVAAVTVSGAQTLTNKTLTSPIIDTPTLNGSGGTLSLPAGPDTLVGRTTAQTLTNKTLTTPVINGGTLSSVTLLGPTDNSGGTINGGFVTGITNSGTLTNSGTISGGSISGATMTSGAIQNAVFIGTSHTATAGDLSDWLTLPAGSTAFSATNVTGAAGTTYFKLVGPKLLFVRYHFTAGTVTSTGTIGLPLPALASASVGRQMVPSHGLIDAFYVGPSGTTLTSYQSLTVGANLTGYTAQGFIEVA